MTLALFEIKHRLTDTISNHKLDHKATLTPALGKIVHRGTRSNVMDEVIVSFRVDLTSSMFVSLSWHHSNVTTSFLESTYVTPTIGH